MAFWDMFKRQTPQSQAMMLPDTGQVFSDDLADYVNDEYERRQNERKAFELQWRLNAEFVNGNQYLDINTTTLTIEEIPRLNFYQEREVFNQIGPIFESRVSRLNQAEPILKTRPTSSEDHDISSAKISSMLLRSTWKDQKMDMLYEDLISWLELHGTTMIKSTWNPKKGQIIGQMPPVTNQQDPTSTAPDGEENTQIDISDDDYLFNQTGEMEDIYEGDIDTVIVPAHEFFPDSSWRDGLQYCRSVIHARAYHIDEIEEMWGIRVEPESVDVMTLQRVSSGLGGLGYSFGSFRTSTTRVKNHAVLKEYYERPTKKYPQGRYIVVAHDKCLYAGPLPHKVGDDGDVDFPFVRLVSIHRPGCFWGHCTVERLIPLQRRYNSLRNRKAEYLNLVAIGQWLEPIGALEEESELNNAPGNIIRYRQQLGKPEPVSWPSLPPTFETEETTLLNEFTQISGMSELARMSNAPPGVKSGVALGIASQQDDTRLSSTSTRIANGVIELGKMWLRLYRQFVQEPRLLRIVGELYDVELRDWTASDLKSDDVIIENSSALAETPIQRRSMVFNLLAAGLFNDPTTGRITPEIKQKIFQMLDFGDWEDGGDDDTSLQKSRARKENMIVMSGQPIQVMDFDDHMLHVKQHNHMRMQPEYDEMLKTPIGPMIDQMVRMHIGQHLQAFLMGQQSGGISPPIQQQAPQAGQPLPDADYLMVQQSRMQNAAQVQQNSEDPTQNWWNQPTILGRREAGPSPDLQARL